jgi:hypothetical protein
LLSEYGARLGSSENGSYDLLKSGGALVVVVHDWKSVSARILGMKSPIFDIEHFQLFCPATTRHLFERANFRDITVRALWNRYPLRYWMKLLPIPLAVKRPLLGALKMLPGSIPLALPPGNLIGFGFK